MEMIFFALFMALAMGNFQVAAKTVLAHFMMLNSADYTLADYQYEIGLAKSASIDAFALNIAAGEKTNGNNLQLMFTAAENSGFKLIFSFDYAGNGAWDKSAVLGLINKYKPSSAYLYRGSQPVVSTFEGPTSSGDWTDIKGQTNAFFIPSYSSIGAKRAMNTGVVDGLFNWGAWPEGPNVMDAHIDASYIDFLGNKPYMMPVSPWFYTNMPGFGKNWMWRGDHLWFDRWVEIWVYQPEFVQIISWNDYGESHYVGPLSSHASAYEAFGRGNSPFNYATGMPHDGWRLFLPYVIEVYKTGTSLISREGVQVWYRRNPKSVCSTGGTTGNTASQLQQEIAPSDIVEDRVFFSALMGSFAFGSVTIGGVAVSATWDAVPDGGTGLYHGSAPTSGLTGQVVVTISRNGGTVVSVAGDPITTGCFSGYNNWNAYTAGAWSPSSISARPRLNIADMKCTKGTGVNDKTYNLKDICEFTCKNGYCPLGACTCQALGAQPTEPATLQVSGFPQPGALCIYLGLCSYACNHGFCPSAICTTDPSAKDKCFIPPPDPDNGGGDGSGGGEVCIKGQSTTDGNLMGLCDYSCHYGYCPTPQCTCLLNGTQIAAPPVTQRVGYPLINMGPEYVGLCAFTWSRGYQATGACTGTLSGIFVEHPNPSKDDCAGGRVSLHWTCFLNDCSVAGSLSYSPSQQWASVEAQTCLEDVTAWYSIAKHTKDTGVGYGFPDWASNQPIAIGWNFGGLDPTTHASLIPPDYTCDIIGASGCAVPVKCGELQYASVALVEQSFGNVRNFYQKYWDSISDVEVTIKGHTQKMADTFIRQSTLGFLGALKEILESFDTVFQLAGAGVWEKALSAQAFKYWTKTTEGAESVQGALTDSIGAYEAIGGEVASAESTKVANLEKITDATDLMFEMLRTGINSYMKYIFGGSDFGAKALVTLLSDGLFLVNPSHNISQGDMGAAVSTAITARLIQTCWSFDDHYTPAVLIVDSLAEFLPSSNGVANPWLDSLSFPGTNFQYKDYILFFLNVPKNMDSIGGGTREPSGTFQAVYGKDAIADDDNEWGVTWKEFAMSAFDGWLLNNKQNPYSIPKSTDMELGGPDSPTFFPLQQGAATPGFFNVPVCNASLAKDNWEYFLKHGKPCEDIYPCCAVKCTTFKTADGGTVQLCEKL